MTTYLKIDELGLVDDLKSAVVHIVWNDRGEQRHSKVTLQPAYFRASLNDNVKGQLLETALSDRTDPSKVKALFVWDIENNLWRAIPLDRINMCQLTQS